MEAAEVFGAIKKCVKTEEQRSEAAGEADEGGGKFNLEIKFDEDEVAKSYRP